MPSHPDRVRRNYPEGVPVFGSQLIIRKPRVVQDGCCDYCGCFIVASSVQWGGPNPKRFHVECEAPYKRWYFV